MRKFYIVDECAGGFMVRPRDRLDNARWYFDALWEAEEWANYLERTRPW